jgi:hypothetical protein
MVAMPFGKKEDESGLTFSRATRMKCTQPLLCSHTCQAPVPGVITCCGVSQILCNLDDRFGRQLQHVRVANFPHRSMTRTPTQQSIVPLSHLFTPIN